MDRSINISNTENIGFCNGMMYAVEAIHIYDVFVSGGPPNMKLLIINFSGCDLDKMYSVCFSMVLPLVPMLA